MIHPLPDLSLETLACPDCDLLQRIPPLAPGAKARCLRCGYDLAKRSSYTLELPLALTVTAVIVFVIANTSPLLGMSAVGRHASTTIIGGAYEMWSQGQRITGVVVAYCAVIAPAGCLLFMLAVLLAARRFPAPPWVGEVLRWAHHLQVWAMLEVMMLGILVALIKIAELATVSAGIGMYAVAILMMLFPAIMVTFDPREVWRRIEGAGGAMPSLQGAEAVTAGATR